VLTLPPDPGSRDIRALADRLGASLAYVPSMRNGEGAVDRGNAILSSHELSDLLIVELPFERQRRTAMAAAVTGVTEGGRVWHVNVVNAHFDTAPALGRGGPAAARRRQADALIDAIEALRPPVVVAGDLNTSWGTDEPAFKHLHRVFPDAVARSAAQTWRGRFAIGARLDHMLARLGSGGAKLIVHRVARRYGSDHHPLVAVVELE
jgi:endonuclease/exonuclease/phosphatase family metal-dependent hydrolase